MAGTLTEYDMNTSPVSSIVHAIPAGHTVASVTCINVANATSGSMRVRPSIAGTPASIDLRVTGINHTQGFVSDSVLGGLNMSDAATSGTRGHMRLHNLNTAAPITCFVDYMNGVPQTRGGVFKSIVSYDEIYIDMNNGGTMTAGIIYVVTYPATNEVLSMTFSGESEWDINDMTPTNSSLIVLSSYNLVLAASKFIGGRVSTDGGSTFEDGATDYLRTYMYKTQDDVTDQVKMTLAQTSGTTGMGMCAMIMGLPLAQRTTWRSVDMKLSMTDPRVSVGWRAAIQVEDALRIYADATTFTSGTLYVTRYNF